MSDYSNIPTPGPRQGRNLVVLAMAVLIGLSSCSRDQVSTSTPDLDVETTATSEQYVSPLTRFFRGYADPDLAVIDIDEQISSCMVEQGFDWYVGHLLSGSETQHSHPHPTPDDGEIEPYSAAWVARYGFGISTLYFPQSQVGNSALGWDDSQRSDSANFEPEEDPNLSYYEELELAAQLEYEEALWGPDGCSAQAELTVFGRIDQFEIDFEAELAELEQEILLDPGLLEFEQEWERCLAEAGFLDYVGLVEYERSLYSELERMALEEVEPAEGADGLLRPQLTNEAATQLADMQKHEIAFAVESAKCSSMTEILGAYQAARSEAEERFISSNAEKLEEYR